MEGRAGEPVIDRRESHDGVRRKGSHRGFICGTGPDDGGTGVGVESPFSPDVTSASVPCCSSLFSRGAASGFGGSAFLSLGMSGRWVLKDEMMGKLTTDRNMFVLGSGGVSSELKSPSGFS